MSRTYPGGSRSVAPVRARPVWVMSGRGDRRRRRPLCRKTGHVFGDTCCHADHSVPVPSQSHIPDEAKHVSEFTYRDRTIRIVAKGQDVFQAPMQNRPPFLPGPLPLYPSCSSCDVWRYRTNLSIVAFMWARSSSRRRSTISCISSSPRSWNAVATARSRPSL